VRRFDFGKPGRKGIVAPNPAGKKRKLVLGLSLIFLAAVAAVVLSLGSWNAPAAARRLQNPVTATESAVDEGMFVYSKNCKSCHGEDGDGKGERAGKLGVRPTNFTNARQMSHLSDGELFWKITHGRRPMPAFEDKLTETQRWQVVDYIRTLAKPNP
jgi:mono/diheme cytochrome c family protein